MNNSVYDGYGKCIGYRCFTCGEIFQSMWDCTCNSCRKKEELHREQMKAMRELTEAIKQSNRE